MSIWEKYSKEEQEEYIKFLQVYGALTNLFRQKHGGAEVPDYEIIQDNQEKLKDMSFRALFDNCNEAQYQVAMLLQQQLASKFKEAAASSELLAKTYEFNALENRSMDLLKYAQSRLVKLKDGKCSTSSGCC